MVPFLFFTTTLSLAFVSTLGLAGCTGSREFTDLKIHVPENAREHAGETLRFHLKTSETLRLNFDTEPPTLDWSKASDTTSGLVIDNLMDGLVQYDLNDPNLRLLPALARSWTPSDSARKWVFDLRDDVKWTDGVPFTPQHVVDGWHRLLDPKTASEYSSFLFPIAHAKEFNEGKASWDQVGVHITGPHQITVELEKPMGYFPMLLTHHATCPLRMDLIRKYGEDRWVEPENLVTLGPFKLKAWAHDKALVFEANPAYYEGAPKIKNIIGYIIQEPQTALSLYESGQIDAIQHLPSTQVRTLRGRPDYHEIGTMTIAYYGFNVQKRPVNDVHIRRAIGLAIDRREITKVLGGGQTTLSGWMPPGVLGYDEKVGLHYDPVKARENLQIGLKALGYSSVETFPHLEIRFNSSEDYQKIAENIQAQLKRNLGVQVELKKRRMESLPQSFED